MDYLRLNGIKGIIRSTRYMLVMTLLLFLALATAIAYYANATTVTKDGMRISLSVSSRDSANKEAVLGVKVANYSENDFESFYLLISDSTSISQDTKILASKADYNLSIGEEYQTEIIFDYQGLDFDSPVYLHFGYLADQPDNTYPDAMVHDIKTTVGEILNEGLDVTNPVTTNPVTTDPVTTNPVTTDPVTTNPVDTKPVQDPIQDQDSDFDLTLEWYQEKVLFPGDSGQVFVKLAGENKADLGPATLKVFLNEDLLLEQEVDDFRDQTIIDSTFQVYFTDLEERDLASALITATLNWSDGSSIKSSSLNVETLDVRTHLELTRSENKLFINATNIGKHTVNDLKASIEYRWENITTGEFDRETLEIELGSQNESLAPQDSIVLIAEIPSNVSSNAIFDMNINGEVKDEPVYIGAQGVLLVRVPYSTSTQDSNVSNTNNNNDNNNDNVFVGGEQLTQTRTQGTLPVTGASTSLLVVISAMMLILGAGFVLTEKLSSRRQVARARYWY